LGSDEASTLAFNLTQLNKQGPRPQTQLEEIDSVTDERESGGGGEGGPRESSEYDRTVDFNERSVASGRGGDRGIKFNNGVIKNIRNLKLKQ
jgi:hypothetical protein